MSGVIYRVAHADPDQLRTIVEQVAGLPCWTFGGATLWDLDGARGQGNLRPIAQIESIARLNINGDFGHAFMPHGEVRWKRIAQDAYDVLILTDKPPDVDGAKALGETWKTRKPSSSAWMLLETPRDDRERGKQWRLGYIEYLAPNDAVQFVRYKEVSR